LFGVASNILSDPLRHFFYFGGGGGVGVLSFGVLSFGGGVLSFGGGGV